MASEQNHQNLTDNSYRLSVLGFFTRGYTIQTDKITDAKGHGAVDYKITNGLASVKMKMPDGQIEYWQQTDFKVDAGSGFRAHAFQRCNKDGSPYLDDKKQPSYMLCFPGNTGDIQDRKTIEKVLTGQDLEYIYRQVDSFTNDFATRVRERAEKAGHGIPSVVMTCHSIGNNALAANLRLKEKGVHVPQVILYEPVGAGQALQQLTVREGLKRFGPNLTPEKRNAAASALTENVISIRSSGGTIFHEKGGNDEYDNVMIGKTYLYQSNSGPEGTMADHMFEPLAQSLWRHGRDALVRTDWNDRPAGTIASGGPPLSEMEKIWAALKLALFDILLSKTTLFNSAAAHERHENPSDKRPDFANLSFTRHDTLGPSAPSHAKPVTVY